MFRIRNVVGLLAGVGLLGGFSSLALAGGGKVVDDTKTVRVFIFAGQSNMVGSDSRLKDVKRFPPFVGLDAPQEKVMFSYNLGREEKRTSNGWVALQPVDKVVGPELSFGRRVTEVTKAPIGGICG